MNKGVHMESLEKNILELIPEKNQERAKELINKLKLDAVEEFTEQEFKDLKKQSKALRGF